VMKCDKEKGKGRLVDEVWQRERKRKNGWWSVAKRKEKEDWVMKCGKEKGKGRLGDEVWQRERKGENTRWKYFNVILRVQWIQRSICLSD
jgi:cytochrome c556